MEIETDVAGHVNFCSERAYNSKDVLYALRLHFL